MNFLKNTAFFIALICNFYSNSVYNIAFDPSQETNGNVVKIMYRETSSTDLPKAAFVDLKDLQAALESESVIFNLCINGHPYSCIPNQSIITDSAKLPPGERSPKLKAVLDQYLDDMSDKRTERCGSSSSISSVLSTNSLPNNIQSTKAALDELRTQRNILEEERLKEIEALQEQIKNTTSLKSASRISEQIDDLKTGKDARFKDIPLIITMVAKLEARLRKLQTKTSNLRRLATPPARRCSPKFQLNPKEERRLQVPNRINFPPC